MLANVEAIIFDLDGTLTRPVLDFDAIRTELGLPPGPLLEQMEAMSAEQRRRVEQVLHRHEADAAHNSELHDGAGRALRALHDRGLRLAILTRNSRRSVQTVLDRHGLTELFDVAYTREDGPAKPSPQPVLEICQRLGVPAGRTWVVGDYLFDIQAGRAAGAGTTVLMIGQKEPPEYADQADHVIRRLDQLLELVDV